MKAIIKDDAVILKDLQHPDNKTTAFRSLLAKYQERIYVFIRRLIGSHEDADEYVQDVFVKFYQGLNRIKPDDDLALLLFGLAVKEVLLYLYRRPRGGKSQEESREDVILALKQEQFSFADIATMTGMQPSEVKLSFQAAVKRNTGSNGANTISISQ